MSKSIIESLNDLANILDPEGKDETLPLSKRKNYSIAMALGRIADIVTGETPSWDSDRESSIENALQRIITNWPENWTPGGGGGNAGMDIICTRSEVGEDTVFTTEKTAGEIRDILLANPVPIRFVATTDYTDANQKFVEVFLVTDTIIWYNVDNPSVVDAITMNILDAAQTGTFVPTGEEEVDWTKPMTYTRSATH